VNTPGVSKKIVFSWACFDFANSAFSTLVVTFIYSSFFAKGVALDEVSGSTSWANTVAISSVCIALLSPPLGAIADAYGWKRRMMFACVITCVVCTALLYFPQRGDILLALILFAIANTAIELSIVFNNAFLPDIAPKEHQGKVSGQAWAFGYVGGLLCLVIALVGFISEDPWFGLTNDAGQKFRATNLLVAVWFTVFSIPMLLWVKEKRNPKKIAGIAGIARHSFARLADTLSHLRGYKELFWLLIARLFYNDGIVTVFAFGGIYAMGTFDFEFNQLVIFGIALNMCAGLGAFVFSFAEDRIGSRKTILISLYGLLATSSAAIFIQSQNAFWVCAILLGLFVGPNQSASRAYLSQLTPADKTNEFFGFFAFSGKATAFAGPLLFAQFTGLFDSQRAGMACVPVLVLIGMLLLTYKTKSSSQF